MNPSSQLREPDFFSNPALVDSTLSYADKRSLALEVSRKYLDFHRQRIRGEHEAGSSGRQVVGSLTEMIDTLLRNLSRIVAGDLSADGTEQCGLIALGGYGRGELNPRSDIDLMFLYSGKDKTFAEALSERMLYLLWDLSLEVGYSVRTVDDCLDMADKDITARTALIDSRFLFGNEILYEEYEKQVVNSVLSRSPQAFIRQKLEENQQRLKKYGSSVYNLEPNIKEGEGGLRDLHTALWVAQVKFKVRGFKALMGKGVLTEPDVQEFEAAYDYLWRIRNQLHYLSERKNEQLHFDQQEKIAHFLGYTDNKKAPAVEQFMQDYYFHATRVEHMSSSLINQAVNREDTSFRLIGYFGKRNLEDGFYILRQELGQSLASQFEERPELMMRAFLMSLRHGVPLSIPLKTMIRDNLSRINDKFRRSRTVNQDFFEILRSESGVTDVLRDMHHLQFLNHFIPEFARIFCKVQHDAYHIYTVDIHSIFAVGEVAKLWSGEYAEKKPLLTKTALDIEKRELLLLAVLFHDIGKGEGKNHSEKGAILVRTISRRMGLNKEDSQRLEFLVRHHLDMAHISQRRDLHDDKLIDQFAKTMEMTENLKMLFLLTFADLKAVGPDVWSEWKGFLLQELFQKTYDVMERGNFRADIRSERVRNRKRKVYDNLKEDFDTKRIKALLQAMGNRYLLSHRSVEITEHLKIQFSRNGASLAMHLEHRHEEGYTQVTISTLDIPGLFSKIAGVMAANGINILGAQIYTHNDGEALDLLQVRGPAGGVLDDQRKGTKVETDLAAVIEGRKRVDDLVNQSRRPSFVIEKAKPKYPSRVDVDNEVSQEYSVIDIYTDDKVGLLYRITKAIKDLGLFIGVSKISTKVDQVADTFYLQDIFGQKVMQPDKIDELKQAILKAVDSD
jgi:[protein-PII] uridylyltransferase